MNLKYIFLGFAMGLLLVISGLTSLGVWEIRNTLPAPREPFGDPGDKTVSPAPGSTGPYSVCTYDYDLAPSPDQWGYGRIYVPLVRDDLCDDLRRGNFEANRDFNLVVIAHADSLGPLEDAHLRYDGLAHLTSE